MPVKDSLLLGRRLGQRNLRLFPVTFFLGPEPQLSSQRAQLKDGLEGGWRAAFSFGAFHFPRCLPPFFARLLPPFGEAAVDRAAALPGAGSISRPRWPPAGGGLPAAARFPGFSLAREAAGGGGAGRGYSEALGPGYF